MCAAVAKMDSNLTSMWVNFFTAAGIPSDVSATYALTFTENRIQSDMLLDLNKEYLRDMGISRMGDVIAILRHAKQVHENTARDRVLSSAVPTKVPVAAVTGRATVSSQPSSPASRILEHYTRNPQVQDSPSPTSQLKRKALDVGNDDIYLKKSRLIRFAPTQQTGVKEGSSKTVFARLGNSESGKVSPVTTKASVKPIYARLGSKADKEEDDQAIPIEKDALKYAGILKNTVDVSKKVFTVTTSKNNVRKIAVGTMRADEAPVSVKTKLAKPKSVKFSNQIQYKEIDSVQLNQKAQTQKAVQTPVPKFTPVFNKPERRLSMPPVANNGIKARLGQKNTNNLTITRNVFNRLGV
ncbi:hypothetical protein SFRURICE_010758 [Spodoptera frugiperda]|uniref:Uncharacterized protein C19orf47 n=1 Tax=Spodoptera frugiperda TaxID=7108 RepID=A0A9R0DKG2_SPOFR|nr:uncharacterized protein C19orf47 [Spodoptera frugiperda]KAF9798341.1 hypothetical protein SFRURICE_010758 [Spodoptera frugiperda]